MMAAILLLAAGVRFHLLGAQSLWHDEGNSLVQATRSFTAIADNAARDIHPPGYYWLLAIWRRLTGDSEFALRALSAFASVMTVAFAYALGKRLTGRVAGLTAAGMVALNTFSVYYAQETRMYALLALWGAASMWAFVGFIQSASFETRRDISLQNLIIRYAIGLSLLNVAGLYTQYAYPFVMLAQGIAFVAWLFPALNVSRRTGTLLRAPALRWLGVYIALNVATILLYLPWLSIAW
jgi:uncharacterized membrane protein